MQSEEKVTLEALLQKDLKKYLDNAGLLELLEKNQLTCGICGNVLKLEEITAIYYEDDNEPRLACNRPLCYQEALGKNNS